MPPVTSLTELSEYAFTRPLAPDLPHAWWRFCRLWTRLALEMWARTRAPLYLSPPPGVTPPVSPPDVHLRHPVEVRTVCGIVDARELQRRGERTTANLAKVTCRRCLR